jgi:hypothetical protein
MLSSRRSQREHLDILPRARGLFLLYSKFIPTKFDDNLVSLAGLMGLEADSGPSNGVHRRDGTDLKYGLTYLEARVSFSYGFKITNFFHLPGEQTIHE